MQDIRVWLRDKIAEESGFDSTQVSYDEAFESFKLDSLSLLSLSYELESLLERDLDPTLFTEYNTINKLAAWLEEEK